MTLPEIEPTSLSRAEKQELLRHSDKLGKRSSPHLVHDLAAVNLNGYFADPEFGSNLLIEHSETTSPITSCSRGLRTS